MMRPAIAVFFALATAASAGAPAKIASAKKAKAPVVSEAARKAFVGANTVMGEAKTPADYADAARLYEQAAAAAPGWADPYFNLAKARELGGEFDPAIAALKRYIALGGADARQAQDLVYAFEVKRDRAAKKAEEASETLIVPGRSAGRIRLGMGDDELGRILGVAGEVGRYVREYRTPAISVNTNMQSGLVTHIYVYAKSYATKDGLGIGAAMTDVRASLGEPSEVYTGPNFAITGLTGHCYRINGGASWFWYGGAQAAERITIVPGCDYR